MILTPELVPIRSAPAAIIAKKSSVLRIPPAALTLTSGPTFSYIAFHSGYKLGWWLVSSKQMTATKVIIIMVVIVTIGCLIGLF